MQEIEKPKELYHKKGEMMANGAVSAIVTLIVGVGVAVLVLIFVGVLGGQTYNIVEDDLDAIGNNAVTNDGFTAINSTGVNLDHSFIQTGTLTIQNATGGGLVNLNNFTIDYDAGRLTLIPTADISLNDTLMTGNYTWGAAEVGTSAKEGILGGFNALKQTGNYLPIIVLAVVIALVLSIVIGFIAFGGGKNNSGTAL